MQPQKAERISAIVKKSLLLVLTICSVNVVFSNPNGGNVTNGNATISHNGNSTIIKQNSRQAVIEWKSFNIGKHESTHFQQVAGGIALNRIDGNQGMSQIFGVLTASGKIILVNPAGIYFGMGAVISVGGMIASTSNISNANFLAGKLIFDEPSRFPNASIINEGSIRAVDYGLIALIGNTVTNHGLIEAELGNIVLATGNKFTFDFYGDQLINFSVDAPVSSGGKITNTGALLADGGRITVTAQVAQGVLDNVIDMEGVAQARSVAQQDGQIILLANSGEIKIGGKLNTDSLDNGTQAGTITITAPKVTITTTGILSANGSKRGGNVTLAADSTKIAGKISAQGSGNNSIGGNITIAATQMDFTHAVINASGHSGGGHILFKAPANANSAKSYINVDSGTTILADALNAGKGGTISMQSATALVSGKVSATGKASGAAGGAIEILANAIQIAPGAVLTVRGEIGGGSVVLANAPAIPTNNATPYINVAQGSSILADAISGGKGGDISLLSDRVTVAGTLSANGTGAGTYGGGIKILANQIQIAPHAVLTVRGDIGGGNVVLAGKNSTAANPQNAEYINVSALSTILADAVSAGTAGNIVLFGDTVSVAGTISAVGIGTGGRGGNIGIYGNTINVLPGAFVTAEAQFAGGLIIIGINPYSPPAQNPHPTSVTIALGSQISAAVLGKGGLGGTIKIASNQTVVAGKLDVSAKNENSSAGILQLTGANIDIQPMALLDASGSKAGGQILLGSNLTGSIDTSVVNVDKDSVLDAHATGVNASGGLIQIYAENTNVLGTLNASAATANSGGRGGVVKILAHDTLTIGANANILAMGDVAGGTVLIGGDQHGAGTDPNAQHTTVAAGSQINTSAVTNGTGGNVVVWSDMDTKFAGTLAANGGMYSGDGGQVEVSAAKKLTYEGKVDLRASKGATGTLTLDPQNLTIQNNPGNSNANESVITVANLESALATANVLIVTGYSGNAPGDITVANDVAWANANKLTLSAFRDINVNAKITNNAGGSLVLNADNTRDGVGTINFGSGGHVTMTGGGEVVFNYEPNNGNFRNPNTYADNVTVGNGTTVAFNALNTVTPADNEAIISNQFVLPNVLASIGMASLQEAIDVIIPSDNNVVVAMDNNLETITETNAPGFAIKVMDNSDSTSCNKASCVSNDFVIE